MNVIGETSIYERNELITGVALAVSFGTLIVHKKTRTTGVS